MNEKKEYRVIINWEGDNTYLSLTESQHKLLIYLYGLSFFDDQIIIIDVDDKMDFERIE